jgi:hypothetical protein
MIIPATRRILNTITHALLFRSAILFHQTYQDNLIYSFRWTSERHRNSCFVHNSENSENTDVGILGAFIQWHPPGDGSPQRK